MAKYRLSLLCLLLAACFLWLAVSQRVGATYLEDDLLWLLPSVEHTLHTQSLYGVLKAFHASEMDFSDGMYFSFLLTLFGHHFPAYAFISFITHFFIAVSFFMMLVLGLRLSQGLSLLASLIYLTFDGHYHAYLWPMAAHHLWVLFISFLTMTLYLIADRRLDEGKNINTLYGWLIVLAVCAGLNRQSILVLPLMMAAHIAFTNKDTSKVLNKIRRWLPVFYLMSVYVVVVIFSGGPQAVLDKFLHHNAHQWPWFIVAAGWAVFILCLYGALCLALRKSVINKLYSLRRPWYGLLFFSYPMGVCCYTWFAPMASIQSRGVFQRWQPMALPEGIWAHTIWWFLGTVLLLHLIRTAVVKRDLLIVLVWYLFLIPYLALQGENIPSRYLIYVSPVFALGMALFWQELKWKWIKTFGTVVLVILMALNIWAIHLRSLSSWITDYRWSYDFVKDAQFIKADLMRKAIKPVDASLCVQHVSPMPYLNNWRGKFLSEDFGGFSPLIDITQSVLGAVPRSFSINKPCASEDQKYDALMMNSSRVRILNDTVQADSRALYAQDYDADTKIIQNDRLIYQDSVFSKPLDFAQGRLIGTYKGFSIFYFGQYFFIIRGNHFNLIQFKINRYKPGYAAKTLWEARQWIDRGPMPSVSQDSFSMALRVEKSYTFKMSWWGIPIGQWLWQIGQGDIGQHSYTSCVFTLKPYGYVYTAILDGDFLPIQSQEGSLVKFKKNLVPVIMYNHQQDIMQRRGYTEDILVDTRDMAGLFTWILKQHYQQNGIYRSSFHEGRDLYLCEIIPVKMTGDKILINIHIARILRDLTTRPWGSLEALLNVQGDLNLPVQLTLKFGFLHIPINFKTIGPNEDKT
jgi:hypothetical protein